MSRHPRSSQGVGAAWERSPCRGGSAPGAQHRLLWGRVSSSLQGCAWTTLGSSGKGRMRAWPGQQRSERAATTAAHLEGTGFWKSFRQSWSSSLGHLVSAVLGTRPGWDHLDSGLPQSTEVPHARAPAQGGASHVRAVCRWLREALSWEDSGWPCSPRCPPNREAGR